MALLLNAEVFQSLAIWKGIYLSLRPSLPPSQTRRDTHYNNDLHKTDSIACKH